MNQERWAQLAEKFINLEIVGLAFLLPLFFLPVTTEFFQFNKLTLLAVATVLGYLAWGLINVSRGGIVFRRSPFDLPVLVILGATALSTALSDSPLTSLIGPYGRFYPSLPALTLLTLFYFLVSTHLKEEARLWVTRALVASGAIAVALFLPAYFGQNLFGQAWSGARSFTPLGSPTILAAFAAIAALLALREAILSRAGARLGFLVLAGFLTLAPILIYAPFDLSGKGTFPREIRLDLATSWTVSATAFRQDPFWGSGPATFAFDFTRYKPLRFNQTALWNIRFDKPVSEYLLVLAELGILGVLAYLFLIVKFLRFSAHHWFSFAPWLGGLVFLTFLFTYADVTLAFLIFLALGSVHSHQDLVLNRRLAASSLALFVTLALVSLWGVSRVYGAEIFHRQALNAGLSTSAALTAEQRALDLFPWFDVHRTSAAQTTFRLANELAGRADLTDEEKTQIQVYVAEAIRQAREATSLSRLSTANWENLAALYRSLIGLATDAESWAADSYQRAVGLDLFNPVLRVNFGGLYYQLGDFERAAEQFKSAVNLKVNYANAHYNLARAYQQLEKIDLAIQELELALQLSSPQAEGYPEAQQLLEDLKKQQGE